MANLAATALVHEAWLKLAGSERQQWRGRAHFFDAAAAAMRPILIDQGSQDQFLDLLMPEALAEAMAARRQEGAFRMQKGYDHSYFFVSSLIEEHLGFHARALYD